MCIMRLEHCPSSIGGPKLAFMSIQSADSTVQFWAQQLLLPCWFPVAYDYAGNVCKKEKGAVQLHWTDQPLLILSDAGLSKVSSLSEKNVQGWIRYQDQIAIKTKNRERDESWNNRRKKRGKLKHTWTNASTRAFLLNEVQVGALVSRGGQSDSLLWIDSSLRRNEWMDFKQKSNINSPPQTASGQVSEPKEKTNKRPKKEKKLQLWNDTRWQLVYNLASNLRVFA